MSSEDICNQLLEEEEVTHSEVSTLKRVQDYWTLLFNPGKLIHTNIQSVNNKSIIDGTVNTPTRNIIFSLGINLNNKEKEFRNDVLDKLTQLRKVLEDESEKISKIIKSTDKRCIKRKRPKKTFRDCSRKLETREITYNRCMKTIEEVGFDFYQYNEKIKKFNHLKKYQEKFLSSKYIKENLEKIQKDLRLNWELIEYTDINEVYEALKLNPDVQNVIILAHGSRLDGRIYDSKGIEFHPDFFEGISNNIYSLGIFSCHSDKISNEGVYEIKKHLLNSGGPYPEKYFISASANTDFLGNSGVKPIGSFFSYLKDYDEFMSTKTSDLEEYSTSELTKVCSLEVKGIEVPHGTLAFRLNRMFIGTSDNDSNIQLKFPCNYLDNQKNLLFLEPALQGTTVDLQENSIELKLDYFHIVPKDLKIFKTPEGKLRSAKINF